MAKLPDEFHFMLCGSNALENDPANDAFDYQIYSATTGNNYFSFISACMSAALTVPNGFSGTYGLNQDGTGLLLECLMHYSTPQISVLMAMQVQTLVHIAT